MYKNRKKKLKKELEEKSRRVGQVSILYIYERIIYKQSKRVVPRHRFRIQHSNLILVNKNIKSKSQ